MPKTRLAIPWARVTLCAALAKLYAGPMFRQPMPFSERIPISARILLVSALVLRNPRVLPAR